MSWNAIAESDVLTALSPAEQAKLTAIQGATDNLPTILTRAVNACRSAVISGGGQIDQPNTVPDLFRREVITIALWDWITSIPKLSETMANKQRQSMYDKAIERQDKIATGELKVDVPGTPLVTAAPGYAVSTPRPGRHVRTDSFDKLGAT
jgi:hypothetical protein